MQQCHAETYCRQFNEERSNCHEHCLGYVQLQNIYHLSNIPKKYQYALPLTNPGLDRNAYIALKSIQDDIKNFVQQGRGLFLISETKGNGKTSWACKLMNEYFKRVALMNNLRCRGLFINVPDFLEQLRIHMKTPSDKVESFIENIHECDIVIWDDIGTEKPSDWVRERLYTFINHRESNGLSQIFTSNILLEQLMDDRYLGERIASRIAGQCEIVELVGHDRRMEQ